MENVFFAAATWLVLALAAVLVSSWFGLPTALVEIAVGIAAGAVISAGTLASTAPWVAFLSSAGAVAFTFLAGTELEPSVFKTKWKEALAVGLVGFLGPFMAAAAIAGHGLLWTVPASLLAGVALSTTSVAVVYAVMLELGLNLTSFGKGLLAACFINDLGTVIALGLMFSPFSSRNFVFALLSTGVLGLAPFITPWLFRRFTGRASELEAKYILALLFAMGGLAAWAGSGPVLPAYLLGIVLAKTLGSSHAFVRRLRTRTLGFLTHFYTSSAQVCWCPYPRSWRPPGFCWSFSGLR